VVQTLGTQLRITPVLLRRQRSRCVRALGCAGLILGSASGCAGVADGHARLSQLRLEIAALVRAGADACAPRELALARAHADFAAIELRQGDRERMAQHLREAEDNAAAAQLRNSDLSCNHLLPTAADSSDASDRRAGSHRQHVCSFDADGCRANLARCSANSPDRQTRASGAAADGGGRRARAKLKQALPEPRARSETPVSPRTYPGTTVAETKLGFARKTWVPVRGACDDSRVARGFCDALDDASLW
jgi:hypothetical protein